MNNKNKGLGRGLSAIFEIESITSPSSADSRDSLVGEVEIALISPNPRQPRTDFDEDALDELTESIKVLGVIQPITLRKETAGRYIIISGERRFRASQMAGLTSIPAYVREEIDDTTLLEMAIVENIQRQDLNAMEVALSLQRLVDECSLTQDSLAERVGKKRSTVANYLRLLKLPVEVQLALREGLISMGHARAIISVESKEDQIRILRKTLKKSLSVRQVEDLVKKLGEKKTSVLDEADEEFPEAYTRLVERLEGFFTQDISIKKSSNGGGKIVIGFRSDDDIEQILQRISSVSR